MPETATVYVFTGQRLLYNDTQTDPHISSLMPWLLYETPIKANDIFEQRKVEYNRGRKSVFYPSERVTTKFAGKMPIMVLVTFTCEY